MNINDEITVTRNPDSTITIELPPWLPLVGFFLALFCLTASVALIVYVSKAIA